MTSTLGHAQIGVYRVERFVGDISVADERVATPVEISYAALVSAMLLFRRCEMDHDARKLKLAKRFEIHLAASSVILRKLAHRL